MTTAASALAVSPPPQRPAEAVVRALADQPSNSAPPPPARPDPQDLVQISDRAKILLSKYRSGSTLEQLVKELTSKVSAEHLAAVGIGPASETRKPPITTSQQTLPNGSVISSATEVSQTILQQQIFDGAVAVGGVWESTTDRTITVSDVGPLKPGLRDGGALVQKARDKTQIIASREYGLLSESYLSTAVTTRPNSDYTLERTEKRFVETRVINNADGRFIQQIRKNDETTDYSSSKNGVVVKQKDLRSTNTITLLNLDTGEVTQSSQTISSSTTVVNYRPTGKGADASLLQTVEVDTGNIAYSLRGGPNAVVQFDQQESSKTVKLDRTIRSSATPYSPSATAPVGGSAIDKPSVAGTAEPPKAQNAPTSPTPVSKPAGSPTDPLNDNSADTLRLIALLAYVMSSTTNVKLITQPSSEEKSTATSGGSTGIGAVLLASLNSSQSNGSNIRAGGASRPVKSFSLKV